MEKNRIEAFSDGVIAILITIMVLDLRPPHDDTLQGLQPLWPIFFSYLLSFVYLAIYWNNHHHLFQAVKHIKGKVLWANLHLLFWLSLLPFATAWSGENHFSELPVALYGVVLFFSAVSFNILTKVLLSVHGKDSTLAKALGKDFKGKISLIIYGLAIPLAFHSSYLALMLYTLVAILWLVPDSRIEKHFWRKDEDHPHMK
ncbi:MAG: DUF1211 domain-containing protein [Oligoflexales bacterium]|nr:DUF1211 domain-containing protein [Oligoflexales bacterium]